MCTLMKDKQGILRGKCTVCSCTEYNSSNGKVRCEDCGHVPAKHEKIIEGHCWDSDDTSDDENRWKSTTSLTTFSDSIGDSSTSVGPSTSQLLDITQPWNDGADLEISSNSANSDANSTAALCQVPSCGKVASFDLNTRRYNSPYCHDHLSVTPMNNCNNTQSLHSVSSNTGMSLAFACMAWCTIFNFR